MKITDHDHDEYITTSEFNKLTTENINASLTKADLVAKADFDTNLKSLNKKINSNKTKYLLVETELRKLQNFYMSYFRDKNYFGNDSKNHLVFEGLLQYINLDDNATPYNVIFSWKSKGVSNEIIKAPKSNNNIVSPIVDIATKENVKFNGSCLIENKITYTPQTIVNIYIFNEITKNNPINSYPILENCLFGAVKLTKTPDTHHYKYSGYGIGFDRRR